MKLEKDFIDEFVGFGPTCSLKAKSEYRKLLKEFSINSSLHYKEQLFRIENEGDYVNVILHHKSFNPEEPFKVLTTHYDHVDLAGPGANEKSGVPIILKLAEKIANRQYLLLIADREEANDGKIFENQEKIIEPLEDAVFDEYKKVYTKGGKTDWSYWAKEENWWRNYIKISASYYGLGDRHFIRSLGSLKKNIDLVLNLDSLGGKGDFKMEVCSTNKYLGEEIKVCLKNEGIQTFNNFDNDIASQWQHYAEAGIENCILVIDRLGEAGYKYHHTKEDSIDKISFDKLEKILKGLYNFLKEGKEK